ncbi:MAG TPA: heavy-metal-associated domain-containing protein [Ignavibacteria bacterium]
MKSIIFIILSVFICSHVSMVTASGAKVKTVTFKCKEITCEGCKEKITDAVMSVSGVKSVNVNLKTKIVKVKYNDSLTTMDRIKEAIEESGYSAVLVD